MPRPDRAAAGQKPSVESGPAFSEDAIASEFVARHGSGWRHVTAWGAWYRWNGMVWQRDEAGLVRELVRRVCRSIANGNGRGEGCAARGGRSDHLGGAAHRRGRPARRNRDVGLGRPPDASEHAGRCHRTDDRRGLPHEPSLLLTQITAASKGSGLPDVDELPRRGHRRRQGAAWPTCAARRLLPDRGDDRAGLRLLLRARREREVGVPPDRRCRSRATTPRPPRSTPSWRSAETGT